MSCFSIEKQQEDYYEAEIVINFCQKNNSYTYQYSYDPIKNSIPIGSVEYCEKIYGHIKPDYYPKFLEKYLNRNIYKTEYDLNKSYNNLFVKPANNYKKFNGTINFNKEVNCKVGDKYGVQILLNFLMNGDII